jgi:hypothetical protein
MDRMCGVSPRFSWITNTAPRGVSVSATTPISSPLGPLKRISSPSAVAGASPLEEVGVLDDSPAGAPLDGVAPALLAAGLLEEPSSPPSPQAASRAVAAAAVTPSRPRRRSASRRESSPASQSSATSCTM